MGIQRNMNGLMQSDIFSQTQMSTDTLVQIYKGISISILFYTYIYMKLDLCIQVFFVFRYIHISAAILIFINIKVFLNHKYAISITLSHQVPWEYGFVMGTFQEVSQALTGEGWWMTWMTIWKFWRNFIFK